MNSTRRVVEELPGPRRHLSGGPKTTPRVLGVDACKKGWVGITGDARGHFGATIAELLDAARTEGTVAVVGIDIPIGLSHTGVRQADLLARTAVGARRSSVFLTPVREALVAPTYAEAAAHNLARTGRGISKQAYSLRSKILQVDAWVGDAAPDVLEVHPELSFAVMAGRPLRHAKTTYAGVEERRVLLAQEGLLPRRDLGVAGAAAGVDDVLDAAAACWTARRYAGGRAVSHPDPPEQVGEGRTAAIWA